MSLRLLLGAWWQHRSRWWIAVFAVAIGASVVAGLLLVTRDVERQVAHELKAFGPNLVLVPAGEEVHSGIRELRLGPVVERPTLPEQPLYELLTTEPPVPRAARGDVSVATVTPMLYGAARAVLRPLRWEEVLIAGTDLEALDRMYDGWRRRPSQEPVPLDHVPAHLGRNAAARLAVAPGDTLTIQALVVSGEALPVFVASVFDAGGHEDEAIFLPLYAAQRLLATPGRIHLALIRAEGVPSAIEAAVAAGWLSEGGWEARPLRRMSSAEQEVLDRLGILMGVVTALALLAASLCAMSTLTDMVLERRREVALLKALGASRSEVTGVFLLEASLLGAVGGTLGFVLGAVAAQVIGKSVFDSAIRLDAAVFGMVLVLALGVTWIASWLPVRYALGVEPATILRGD